MLRARLSLFALEGRENPSGPALIDPVGATVPPPAPVPDPTVPVVTTIINIGGAVAGGATDPTPAPTTPTSSLGPVDPLFVLPNP